jgi:predicted lipoprotein with Yx(FWY)xxD motif
MKKLSIIAAAAAVLAFGPNSAFAVMGIMEADTSAGKALTDAKGMTLYTFDKDEGGKSACYDKCAVNWPPLIAPADAKAEGKYGLTQRTDGSMQWTYDGKPLYLWIKDAKPGDVTGDGVNNVWHIAKP